MRTMSTLQKTTFLSLTFLIILGFILQTSLIGYAGNASVVFIYSTDLASSESYRSLLEAHGISVDLVSVSASSAINYSGCGLIIVGNDVQTQKTTASAVDRSGKPILGLGRGGGTFFDLLGLGIGWSKGAFGSETEIYVVDTAHPIFNQPTSINVPSNRIIELYTSTQQLSIYMPSPQYGITPLGRGVLRSEYCTLIQESSRYFLWGFTNSPDYMTQAGKNLFVNVVQYCLQGTISRGGFQIGVKGGDWIMYDHPPEKYEFLKVNGTNLTIRTAVWYSDGTEREEDVVSADIATRVDDESLLSFDARWFFRLIIPANSKVGDLVRTGSLDEKNVGINARITSETQREYAGAVRTVLYLSFSELGTTYSRYYDKQTGVLLEEQYPSAYIEGPVITKAVKTSIWQAASSWPSFDPTMIGAFGIAIIVIIAALLSMLKVKRKKRKMGVLQS